MQTEHPRRLNSPLRSPQDLKRKCSKFRPAPTGVFYCFTLHDHKYQRWSKKLPVHCNRALKTNTFAPSQSRGSSYGILIISSLLHPVKTQVREMSLAKPGSRDEHITLFFFSSKGSETSPNCIFFILVSHLAAICQSE